MSSLVLLAVIGVVEAVVFLIRMRTATARCAWISGLSSLSVTITRIVFVLVGASAALAELPWWQAIAAYSIPASVATVVVHEMAERRKAQKENA